jgi:hypothetical protein
VQRVVDVADGLPAPAGIARAGALLGIQHRMRILPSSTRH